MRSHPTLTMEDESSLSTNSDSDDSPGTDTRMPRSPPDKPADPALRIECPSGGLLLVPTIMVSNSTAALPLSPESSHNVAAHQELPLAMRRGKKPPPTLSLGQQQLQQPDLAERADSDSYPDIPSAFLPRSPTGFSPTSPAFPPNSPSKFDMGLSAMCSNLKALVPPPPFTPTDAEFRRPPSKPPPSLDLETTRWGMVASAQLPDADDEEWGFVHELVVDWHASKGRSAEISPLPPPAGKGTHTAADPPGLELSVSGTTVPCSPASGRRSGESEPDADADDQRQSVQTPACVKQMRRKTVIIQAPDGGGGSQVVPADAERLVKVEKPCNASVERNLDLLLDQFDEPVPFEIPASVPLSAPASLDGSFFTPPSSRPSSTASSARLPVRGILKEKKSVRFSAVPSLYEYMDPKNDELTAASSSATSPKHHSDTDVLSVLKRFPLLASTPHKSSPLRRAHLSAEPGPEEQQLYLLAAATLPPAAPAPVPTTPPRSALPSFRNTSTPPATTSMPAATSSPPHPPPPQSTMAKHPAVRALARRPLSSRQPVSPRLIVGSGPGGAVVGAPSLQSPYPRMPSPPKKTKTQPQPQPQTPIQEQRRPPLKPASVRHNSPSERKPVPASPSPVKQAASRVIARKSLPSPSVSAQRPSVSRMMPRGKENVVSPHIPRTVVSAPNTPQRERDEQARRRATVGATSGTQLRASAACGGAPAGAGRMGSQKGRGSGGSGGSRMPVPLRSIFTKLRT